MPQESPPLLERQDNHLKNTGNSTSMLITAKNESMKRGVTQNKRKTFSEALRDQGRPECKVLRCFSIKASMKGSEQTYIESVRLNLLYTGKKGHKIDFSSHCFIPFSLQEKFCNTPTIEMSILVDNDVCILKLSYFRIGL